METKNKANEYIHKTETDWQMLKTNQWLPVGEGRGSSTIWKKGLRLKTTVYKTDKTAKMYNKAQRKIVIIF